MTSASAAGLFGKIPAHPEFVRVRTGDPAAQALIAWLEAGSEAAFRAGRVCGADPVRFVFSPGAPPCALVGALVGSSDRVGRRFPLAVFAAAAAAADGGRLGAGFGAVPQAARPFLDAAASLLAAGGDVGVDELVRRVEALPPLGDADVAKEGEALRGAAERAALRDVFGALLADPAGSQLSYALHCLRSACQPLRGREAPADGVVLSCPAGGDVQRFAWLELVRRQLGRARPPSFAWTEGEAGRLFVELGEPSRTLFLAPWDPACRDRRLWPVTTEKPTAIEAAQRALGPSLVGLIERHGATLGDLLSTFGA